ncbi:MAG: peptide chain release factor N(5)-glutamine methyltransferase [Cytophagales bacterium]|nr:peptide chain release factor N(5)-glutamine methyltransferase [Armatimonadota bacterium]
MRREGSAAALVQDGARRLQAAGIAASAALVEARLLALHSLGITPEALWLKPERAVTERQGAQFETLLARRAKREPLAYLLGEREFYGRSFRVDASVLIPRPETEFLVEVVLAVLKANPAPRFADVGTGSGIIAVTLAAQLPHAISFATDISPEALAVARENAARQGVRDRVAFAEGDLLAPISNRAPFDAIASNPPYIAPSEIESLEPEVRDWEPRIALGMQEDPLHFYRRLAREAPPLLALDGALAVEVGRGQAEAVKALWADAGLKDIETVRDYAGIERVVVGRKRAYPVV